MNKSELRDDYFSQWARHEIEVGDMCSMLAARDMEIEILKHEVNTMYYGGYREGYDDGVAKGEVK